MTYIYVATRIFTFFGTYLRTFFEHIACRIVKIPAEDVRAFKASEMCGHVEHSLTDNLKQSLLITMLPFTVNLLIGCSILLTGAYRLFFAGEYDNYQAYLLSWLGFSCLANCAPSYEDALALKERLYSSKRTFVKVILSPMFAVYYVCASVERFSLTFVLSAVFTVIFPNIFNVFFPMLEKVYEMLN